MLGCIGAALFGAYPPLWGLSLSGIFDVSKQKPNIEVPIYLKGKVFIVDCHTTVTNRSGQVLWSSITYFGHPLTLL